MFNAGHHLYYLPEIPSLGVIIMEGVINNPSKECQKLNVTIANNVILELAGVASALLERLTDLHVK